MAFGWGVVRTQVLQEDCARRHVADLGYEAFLPKFKTYVVSRGKRQLRVAKLFPSYLFVKFEDPYWHPVQRARGVVGLLMDGERPAVAKDHEIQYLRERFDEEGTRKLDDGRFKRGQSVRALSGPMRDQVGTFGDMLPGDRVNVLFEMMGRRVPVQLGERELAAA
jgi:transcriptional antiterminator RfaH